MTIYYQDIVMQIKKTFFVNFKNVIARFGVKNHPMAEFRHIKKLQYLSQIISYLNIQKKMTPDEEHALCALYDLETHVLPHFNYMASTDSAVHYCIEQAKHHLSQAREFLEAIAIDPQKHFDDGREFYRILAQVLPLMVLAQSFSPPPPDQDEEENSQDTPDSILSDVDTYEPVTPPPHPESESF
jgi:hypothetical protein